MTGVHRLHPRRYACRRTRSALSTTRSTRPSSARAQHLSSTGRPRDTVADLQRLPRARPVAGLLRHRRPSRPSRTRRRSSRSRTCATCTRRSACSACRTCRSSASATTTPHRADQVRGFGFLHDGSVDTVFRFLTRDGLLALSDTQRRKLEQFIFAFDTNLRADRRPAGHADRAPTAPPSTRASIC